MDGVDRIDENISYYRTPVRSKKWWIPFFIFMPDSAVQNGWGLFFFQLVFTPSKAEQLLQGMELQEKETQKD